MGKISSKIIKKVAAEHGDRCIYNLLLLLQILVCAMSNIAVDNLVEGLAKYKTKMVRCGHPARMVPQIHVHSMDALAFRSDERQVVQAVKSEMDHAKVCLTSMYTNIYLM